MKALCIYQDSSLPSSRIRVIQIAPYLEKLGIECTLRCYNLANIKDHEKFDVIILQKKLLSWWDYLYWRRIKTPIIFDIDDAIFIRQEKKNNSYKSNTRSRRFKRSIKVSQSIVVGNAYLANYCHKFKNDINIIPSAVPHAIPLHMYPQKLGNQYSAKIGWVGTSNNLYMLERIIPDLKKLYEDIPFELHVLSNKQLESKVNFPIINHMWNQKTQEEIISTFDIGIMPMEDTPWTKGKCAYKLLQYMSAQVVAIGDSVGMNTEIIKDGKNGILVNNNWHESLLPILQEPKLLNNIAQNGRITVLNGFTYEKVAKKWQKLLLRTTKS